MSSTIDNGQLVIAGSDRRGTIYGIYELVKTDWRLAMVTIGQTLLIEQHKHIYIKKRCLYGR